MNCPLCFSKDINHEEKIKASDIISLWQKKMKMDIGYLLKNQNSIFYYKCNTCNLFFFVPAITGDEHFYEKLSQKEWYYQQDKSEYHIAKKYISKTDNVLEVGAGSGEFAKKIACNNYLGLELNDKAIEQADLHGIKLINQTIEQHQKENRKKYDIVCSFQVLEHIANPNSFIKASLSCLENGGKLIIAVPSHDSYLKFISNPPLNMPPHHVTRWSDFTLQHITELFGLKLLDIKHDDLQNIHERTFTNALIKHTINTLFGTKEMVLNNSLRKKIINKISFMLSKAVKNGVMKEFHPYGHTVVAIYQKKG